MMANKVPPTYRAVKNRDRPNPTKAISNPTAISHAVFVPERTRNASTHSAATMARVMRIEESCRLLNGRPIAAAAIACATTSRVTRRTSSCPGSAGRPGERRSPGRPRPVALTAHLQVRHPRQLREPTYEPNGLPVLPGCSVGSIPLLRDSHRAGGSATGCVFPPPARLYLLDMAGHRGPRQATRIPAASTASPPTAASGRHGKLDITTCAAALTPGVPVPAPGAVPGPAAPPPAIAEPAWEITAPRAAASTSALPTPALTRPAISAPDTARNTPTSRRGRPRVAMTAARAAREATASAPAAGTRSCPLTGTVLLGSGAGAVVTTCAHPCRADASTSTAPAAAVPRTSAYSRRAAAPPGAGPAFPAPLGAVPPGAEPPVTGRLGRARPSRSRSCRRCGTPRRPGPP